MKQKLSKRSLISLIVAFVCAILVACSASLLATAPANALSTADSTGSTTKRVSEITVSGYDSTTTDVFNGTNLSALYDALTNTSDGSATINKVDKLVSSGTKGYANKSIPDYLSAKDLKDKNGYNIVVSFGGFDWDVVFLTRNTSNNHLILTLWMDQPLTSGGSLLKTNFGWANAAYNVTINSGTTDRIANAYGTSALRALGLNGGSTTGNSSYYTSATATASVDISSRRSHPLANFTLDNSVLGNTSLINYLVQPKDVAYTSYLSYVYLDGNSSYNNMSHLLNDALTLDGGANINNTTTKTYTTFYQSASYGAHSGGWWNQGVKNYAVTNSSINGYNDWGSDYVWAPSLPETGYTGCANQSLWGTEVTGQTKFADGSTPAPTSAPTSSTASATTDKYVWLRSGDDDSAYYSQFLSSSGGVYGAFTAASLAVRPALHLDLTSAAQAAAAETIEVPVPQAITEKYDGSVQTLATWAALMNGTSVKYPWIDAYHQDTNIVTVDSIEYKEIDSKGTYASSYTTLATTAPIQHAGEYKITYKIDTSATKYRWRGCDASVQTKELIVKIQQLDMNYDWKFYDQSGTLQTSNSAPYTGGTVSAQLVASNTPNGAAAAGSNMPNLTIYHKGTTFGINDNGGKGSTTGPTDAGSYTATYEDTQTGTDYKMVATLSLAYSITKKQVQLPTVSGTFTYDGTMQSIAFPTGGSNPFDTALLEVTDVKITATDGSSVLTAFDGTDTYATSAGKYSTKINGSNIEVTDAGTYGIEFGLKDTTNTEWASGVPSNHLSSFTINPKGINVVVATPGTNYTWSVGTTGNITVSNINTLCGSDDVTVQLYWYKDGATSARTTMHTTGVPDQTGYDATNLTDAGTYYICAVLANDSTGSDVNRNYFIDATDPNTNDAKVQVQKVILTAGTASMDNVVWKYTTPSMVTAQAVNGSTLTYDKVSGAAVIYTLEVDGFAPATCTATYSQDYAKSAATPSGSVYTAKVTLVIPTSDRSNNEMPNPADGYSYGGDGNYTYVNSYTCEITKDWTIEQKEVDLSNVSFEYSNDNGATWTVYNPSNPPEATGFDLFQVRVPATAIANSGILGATPQNYVNQFGPGVIDFEFDFTLDPNYKAQSGQVQSAVPYQMTTTGKKIQISWVRTTLKDSNGDEIKDASNVPYYVYELDTSNIPAAALPYIKYEYYEVSGSTYGAIISGVSVESHQGLGYVIDPTGLNANSTNPVQVYVRAVLDGVPMVGGVPQYVLVDSPTNPEYKKITVGDNRRPVDITAGSVTSMPYGGSVNISDAYQLADRVSGAMPSTSYKVALYLGSTEIAPDVTGLDFSTLDAGNYTLSFELVGAFDTTHVLTTTGLPFEIKPIELTAPTLKDGVTLTFSGLDQYLVDSLQNFDPTYMEFASNSIHEAYHAGKYSAVINIKAEYAGNYIFVMPTGASTTKAPVRALVDDAVNTVQISNGNATAALDWTINKYVLDTTPNTAWNFTKDGASLSYNGVPASIKALTMGNDPTLIINIAYYDTNGNPLTDVELKGGNKFLVAAYLDPSSADADDIEFKNQAYDPMTQMTTSPQSTYTVPKSGASAALGNLKDFVSKTWLGLPIWAWLLIALALIILLIIIIVVASKRRKTKEQREEIKAKKEEEKQRKEEERQRKEEERQAQKERLEEERRLQKEKLEAERELAKAKQEAELEKIRAQAQAGMGMAAGAGMASMAMQQQPQQQPVQQVVDNTNNELLREMRQQMAEMRAENRATQAQVQAMQNMQNQQPHYAPQYAQPQYVPAPAPAPAAAPAADGNLMTLMEMKLQMSEMKNAQAVAEMKSAQAVAEVKAAQALAEAKAANGQSNNAQSQQQPIIVMAPSSPFGGMGMNQPAMYSPNYPNYGGYPSVNMGYGMQAMPAPQQMMPPYGMVPPYGYPPYGMMPPYGYPPVAMLPQPAYAPAKAEKEEEPVVTSSSQTSPAMSVSQPPYAYPPGAVMTTTTTIDTSKMDGKSVKRTAADSAEDTNFDIDGFYDPFN